jgi:hypothetical protein
MRRMKFWRQISRRRKLSKRGKMETRVGFFGLIGYIDRRTNRS